MASDVIYFYPQSSSEVSFCENTYDIPKGPPSNMSVNNCTQSPYFQCYNRVELGQDTQPVDKKGWNEINPDVYLTKLATGFDRVGCGTCPVPGCEDVAYLSRDPRQFKAVTADYIVIDRPPMSGDVKLSNIYDKKYLNYGLGYTPYNKIVDGQIVYYIDESISKPLYEPVYAEEAKVSSVLFQDPMGSMKPEYTRIPIMNTKNPVVNDREYPYGLSFIQDTQSFREDLISYQQRKNNQEKWSARWN